MNQVCANVAFVLSVFMLAIFIVLAALGAPLTELFLGAVVLAGVAVVFKVWS